MVPPTYKIVNINSPGEFHHKTVPLTYVAEIPPVVESAPPNGAAKVSDAKSM